MGASGWHYFTPYREDIGAALEELRERVFASGEYGQWRQIISMTDEQLASIAPEVRERFVALRNSVEAEAAGLPKPKDIFEALQQSGEEGTHSILDICAGISDEPAFMSAFPMPDAVKMDLYGTTKPMREQVEAALMKRNEDLDRWQCWYSIVYKDGVPNEIYFEGCSGD